MISAAQVIQQEVDPMRLYKINQLKTELILDLDADQKYLKLLRTMLKNDAWSDFHEEIKSEIKLFETLIVEDTDVKEAMSQLFII